MLDLLRIAGLGMNGAIVEGIFTSHRRGGDVVVNRVAKDVVVRAPGRYVLRGLADDRSQFRLGMRASVFGPAFDCAAMSDERTRRLDEHRRMLGTLEDTVGVGAVNSMPGSRSSKDAAPGHAR